MNSIDIKSLLIGILLTSTLFLATGAITDRGDKVQKVQLVSIDESSSLRWEAIKVKVQ